MSQRELARTVGVSTNTVSSWMRGRYRPGREHARRIARTLDVQLDVLLAEIDEPPVVRADVARAERIVGRLAEIDVEPVKDLRALSGDLMSVFNAARAYVEQKDALPKP